MLSAQESLAIQRNKLSTQNVGPLDQNQAQVYSSLSNSNYPPSIRKSRRKRNAKLEEAIPVTINPQLAKTTSGVTFTEPNPYLTTLSESIPSLTSTHLINAHNFPCNFHIECDPYDANNSINHNQISALSIPRGSSLPAQIPQHLTYSNNSSSVINSNSLTEMIPKSQYPGLHRKLKDNIDELTPFIHPTHQNDYKQLEPLFLLVHQASTENHTPSLPLSSSSLSTPDTLPTNMTKSKMQPCQRIKLETIPYFI